MFDRLKRLFGSGGSEKFTKVKLFVYFGNEKKPNKFWEFQLRENIGQEGDIIGVATVGKGYGVDLEVPNRGVSRKHADLVVRQNKDNKIGVNYIDHSSNGSVVNKQMVKNLSIGLFPGSIIKLGLDTDFIEVKFDWKLE